MDIYDIAEQIDSQPDTPKIQQPQDIYDIAENVSNQPEDIYDMAERLDKPVQDPGALVVGGKAALRSAAPLAAGLAAGSALAAKAGLAGAAIGGPVGGGIGFVGGLLVGGMAAGWAANKLQDAGIEQVIGKEGLDRLNQEQEAGRTAHPVASFAGELLPQLAVGRPNPKKIADAWRFVNTLQGAKKAGTSIEKIIATPEGKQSLLALGDVVLGGGTQGSMEAIRQIQEGDFRPIRLMAEIMTGAILNDPTKLGAKLMRIKAPIDTTPVPKIMTMDELKAEAQKTGQSIKEVQESEAAKEQAATVPPEAPPVEAVSPAPEKAGEAPAAETPVVPEAATPVVEPVLIKELEQAAIKPLTPKQQKVAEQVAARKVEREIAKQKTSERVAAKRAAKELAAQTIGGGKSSTTKSQLAQSAQGNTIADLRLSLQKKNLMGEMAGLVHDLEDANTRAMLGQTGLGMKEGAIPGQDDDAFFNQGSAYIKGLDQDSIPRIKAFLANKGMTTKQANDIQIAHDFLVNRLSEAIPKELEFPAEMLKKNDTYEINSEKFTVEKVGKKTVTVKDGVTKTIPRDAVMAIDKGSFDPVRARDPSPETKAIKEAKAFAKKAALVKREKAARAELLRQKNADVPSDEAVVKARQADAEAIVKAKEDEARITEENRKKQIELFGSEEVAQKKKAKVANEADEELINRQSCEIEFKKGKDEQKMR
jgi:hypothetical protein